MKLYAYWRSGTSFRVRAALALKGITVDVVPVHLVRGGGEQKQPAYRAVNPQGRVPSLALDDGAVLTQSPAIIEYLEEVHPEPPLLPADPVLRAKVRAVAAIIGCDVHPLHNSGTLAALKGQFGADEAAIQAWLTKWMTDGFTAVEALIGDEGFAFGPEPTVADVYIVPQVYTARRFNVPIENFPRILRVEALAAAHPAFQAAHPSSQPDAEQVTKATARS